LSAGYKQAGTQPQQVPDTEVALEIPTHCLSDYLKILGEHFEVPKTKGRFPMSLVFDKGKFVE
jgi:hypothetical protein